MVIIIAAAMRKLLTIAYGVVKGGSIFSPPPTLDNANGI